MVGNQHRFYKTTEGPMPAPESDTEPASVECTRMTFDGTELTESQTKRKIYSRHAIAEDTIFQVHQVGGFPFAIQAAAGKIAVRAPAGGLAAGATMMLPIFNNAPGATMTPLFRVQNTWPVEVGNNAARKLYIAMVEGDGDPEAYKVCTADCNAEEETP